MKKVLLISLFFLINTPSWTQQCNTFECAYQKAEQILNTSKAKDKYEKVLANLDDAENFAGNNQAKKENVRALRKKTFVAIQKEKERADEQAKEKQKQAEIAEREKVRADSLLTIAILERKRAENVLEKIYFYSGNFGLAFDYNKGKYGFIDKNMNTKIQFIYDEASSFEINGFSKVTKNGFKYLIDTFGIEYRLATFVHELSDSIDAVDFSSQNIQIFPSDIFKCKNLKILLISDNKLNDIPQKITENKNLRYCDISNNNISTLPTDFGNNQDLQIDIAGNPLLSNKLTGKVATQYDNINRLIVYNDFDELAERIKNDSGTIYLLYFWATWCSPCIKELPFFDLLNNELNQTKTKILLVSLDFTSRLEKNLIPFLKRTDLKPEVVLLADPDANDWIPKICPDWDGSIPFTILLKATGGSKYHDGDFDTYFDLLNWFRS